MILTDLPIFLYFLRILPCLRNFLRRNFLWIPPCLRILLSHLFPLLLSLQRMVLEEYLFCLESWRDWLL